MSDIYTNGFTPLPDVLVKNKRYGLVGAAIVGAVYRHTQMRRGVCDASLKTIAETVGVCERSCVRYLAKAVEDGYLKDETPNLRHSPHTYKATNKVKFVVALGMTHSPLGRTQSPNRSDSESVKESIKETIKRQDNPATIFFANGGKNITADERAILAASQITDLERWGQVVKAYIGCGWSARNFQAMAEWYNRNEIPHKREAAQAGYKKPAGNKRNLIEVIA